VVSGSSVTESHGGEAVDAQVIHLKQEQFLSQDSMSSNVDLPAAGVGTVAIVKKEPCSETSAMSVDGGENLTALYIYIS
jgi:hypothetical protein